MLVTLACIFAGILFCSNAAHADQLITAEIIYDTQLGTTKIQDTASANVHVNIISFAGLDNPPTDGTYTYTWINVAPGPPVTVPDVDTKQNTISTNFDTAGVYNIPFVCHIEYVSASGMETWSGDADGTLTQTVVGVDKIQYRIGGQGDFIDVPSPLVVPVGSNVDFQAVTTPAGATWPNGKPVWGGTSGASGTGATTTVTFNTVSTSLTDYKTVTAECGNTVTANVIVVGIEKLQYELSGTFTDFPTGGLSDICKNASISFKAIIAPAGATWPTGKPVWGGDATGTGEENTVTFSTTGTRTVTVECGNTITASLGVVDKPTPEVTVTQSTPTTYRQSMPSNALGYTDVESLDMDITACHDGTSWHAVLTEMNGNYSIRTRMVIPGVVSLTEITGPGGAAPGTTNATNSCTQVSDLHALSAHATAWYIQSAIIAHENVHASRCEPALASAAQYIEEIIDALEVTDTGQSKAEAIAQMKASITWSNVKDASFSKWLDDWLDLISHDHGLGSGDPITTSGPDEGYAYIAEDAAVAPMIDEICNWRAAQTPPLTGCSVCGN